MAEIDQALRAIAEETAPLPMLVKPGVVRGGRRARVQRFEGDRAPVRRRVAPRRARGRLRLPISARTRAVVALGVTLAVLGVGTMFGLRATRRAVEKS